MNHGFDPWYVPMAIHDNGSNPARGTISDGPETVIICRDSSMQNAILIRWKCAVRNRKSYPGIFRQLSLRLDSHSWHQFEKEVELMSRTRFVVFKNQKSRMFYIGRTEQPLKTLRYGVGAFVKTFPQYKEKRADWQRVGIFEDMGLTTEEAYDIHKATMCKLGYTHI